MGRQRRYKYIYQLDKKSENYIVFLLTLFFEVNMLHAQEMPFPKRESRAVWVTTLMNLDWPRTKVRDASSRERQKEEFRTMLDRLQTININTILF